VNIALQLSGRLRFTEASLSSLIGAIIEPLRPDIFFSFWNPEQLSTLYYYKQVLEPKLVEVENQNIIKSYLDDLFHFNVHKNMPSMSYKFYRVSQLRKSWEIATGTNYDLVIQARSDNIFYEKLDLERCNRAIEENAILCANQGYNQIIDDYIPQPRMVDNFYLGPTSLVDQANETFWQLRYQAQEWTEKGMLHQVRIPEIIQSKIWQDSGIKIRGLPGSGHVGNFWYDIDRSETKWK
jgi:hypothetical protein